MRKLHPTSDQALRDAMADAMHASADMRFLHRIHAVLLVATGQSCYRVAHSFDDDPRSVERWVNGFNSLGIDGLRDHHHGGRPATLSAEQLQQLGDDLEQSPSTWNYSQPCWSGKLLARHLESRFSVQWSVRHCQRLLRSVRSGESTHQH